MSFDPNNNLHAALARVRTSACRWMSERAAIWLREPGSFVNVVDVYASPRRFLPLFAELLIPEDKYLAIQPTLVAGDAFRGTAPQSVACKFSDFKVPGPHIFFLVNCDYFFDSEDYAVLASYLKAGSRCLMYGHQFDEPYSEFKDDDETIASALVYVDRPGFFSPGSLRVNMTVKGNDTVYVHSLSLLRLAGYQAVSSGFLVSNHQWFGSDSSHSCVDEVRYMQTMVVPAPSAFMGHYQRHVMEFWRGWYNVLILGFALLMAVSGFLGLVEEAGPEDCVVANWDLGFLGLWFSGAVATAIFAPWLPGLSFLHQLAATTFFYRSFTVDYGCRFRQMLLELGVDGYLVDVRCYLGFACPWLGWFYIMAVAKAFFWLAAPWSPLILVRVYGWAPQISLVRGRAAYFDGVNIVVRDPELVPSVSIATSTRTTYDEAGFVRRRCFDHVAKVLSRYPRGVVDATAKEVTNLVLFPRSYNFCLDVLWSYTAFWGFIGDLLAGMPALRPVPVVAVPELARAPSFCPLLTPAWELAVAHHHPALQAAFGEFATVPCVPRKNLWRLATLLVGGKEYFGSNVVQCPHSLLLALHLRSFAEVPGRPAGTAARLGRIMANLFALLPPQEVPVLSAVEYIKSFPPARRSVLQQAYGRTKAPVRDVEAILAKPFLNYQIMVKANEVVPKEFPKPRLIACIDPLISVVGGPLIRAQSTYLHNQLGGFEFEYRHTLFYVHYGPGNSLAHLNAQLAECDDVYEVVIDSDFVHYDSCHDQEIQNAIVDAEIVRLAPKCSAYTNGPAKSILRATSTKKLVFTYQDRNSDKVWRFDVPSQLATGESGTSKKGTNGTLAVSIDVLCELQCEVVDLYAFGDDMLARAKKRGLITKARLESAFLERGFLAKVKVTDVADNSMNSMFLKSHLVETSDGSAFRLVPSFPHVMSKLFSSYSVAAPTDRLRQKVDALVDAAQATPLLAQTLSMLQRFLPPASARLEVHPDHVKPAYFCRLPDYGPREMKQFQEFYSISTEEYVSYLACLPEMCESRVFKHVVIDKTFAVEELMLPVEPTL